MSPSNEAFVAAAFQGHPGDEAPWVTGFPGDPFAVSGAFWGGRPVLDRLPFFIRPENNNYVCVSTFRADAAGVWRRRMTSFAAMCAVMVDDIGTKVAASRVALEPSVQVETSPGNSQAWYFLEPPERDRGRAELLVVRMIASGLCADARDPGMRGVTRYGRLPVGCNGKSTYVERLGEPFVQRVLIWQPERRLSVLELAQAYGLDLTPSPRRRARLRSGHAHLDTLVPALEALDLYREPMSGLPGGHHIVCPWLHEHTGMDPSGTVYFDPSLENGWRGGFKCHHGHCIHRGIGQLQRFLEAVKRIERQSRRAA